MDSLLRKLERLHVQYDWGSLFEDSAVDFSTPSATKSVLNVSATAVSKKTPPPKPKLPFSKIRENLTQQYYHEFNRCAFNSKLPEDLEISWSKRMTKTAGFTRMKTRILSDTPRVATVELSLKVIDDEDRLRQTLLHELCHVAAFLIDGISKPPHGDCFWKWAKIAERGISNSFKITTCHSYEINKPFKFTCTNDCCAKVYGRHSKRSIDVTRQICGTCQSSLVFTGKVNVDGTPQKPRAASGFSLFVKNHYASVKAGKNKHGNDDDQMTHKNVMQALSKMYAANNAASALQTPAAGNKGESDEKNTAFSFDSENDNFDLSVGVAKSLFV